jgi:hypothetical protein
MLLCEERDRSKVERNMRKLGLGMLGGRSECSCGKPVSQGKQTPGAARARSLEVRMNPSICVCCGEPISQAGNTLSRNPNLCACCSSFVDGMDEPSVSTLPKAPDLGQMNGLERPPSQPTQRENL